MDLISILIVLGIVPHGTAYWEWNDDPMADKRCSGNIPSYMNWREGIYDLRETRNMYRLVRDTKYGPIEGISVQGVYDTSTYVNLFLGIPYAKPPINEDRFKVGQNFLNFISFLVFVWNTLEYSVLKVISTLRCFIFQL